MRTMLVLFGLLALPLPAQEARAHLGVWLEDHRPELEGILVVGVDPNGCAAKAGLEPGDVIVGVDGVGGSTVTEVVEALRRRGIGRTLEIQIRRGDEERRVEIRLQGKPAGEPARVLAAVPEAIALDRFSACFARTEGAYFAGLPQTVETESASLRCQAAVLLARGSETVRVSAWYCPMHPDRIAEASGECQVCGMPLANRRPEEEERPISPENLASIRARRDRAEWYRSLARTGKAAPLNLRNGADEKEELVRRIERLVADLGADGFQVREDAAKALRDLGPIARPYLEAATSAADQEVAWRARQLLQEIAETPSTSNRRRPCEVEVVEVEGDRIGLRTVLGELLASEGPIQALAVRASSEPEIVTLAGVGPGSARIRAGGSLAVGDRLLWVDLVPEEE